MELMERCDWLTVEEQDTYHSVNQVWRTVRENAPRYFASRMRLDEDNYINIDKARLQLTGQSFKWRAVRNWNKLPDHIRETTNMKYFKIEVKTWIKSQRTQMENR